MGSIFFERRFLTYAIGLMIDRFGNAVYSVALPLLVYSLTRSVLDMSLMAICQFVPRAVCSLFIGSIVDRVSRRTVIFAALLFQGLCSVLLAALFEVHLLEIWMLYAFGALISIGFEFSRTAEIAVVPVMFSHRRVEATSGLASVHTLMFIAGPTLAGFLLSFFTYEVLLWINAISYLGPIVMCLWSRIPNEKDLGGIRTFRSVVDAMGEGLVFLKGHSLLKRLMAVILVGGLATSGIQTLVLFYLKNDLGATDTYTSWVIACSGFGYFVASLLVPRFKNWKKSHFLVASLISSCIGLFLFLIPHQGVLLGAQFVVAVGTFAYSVAQDILIQEIVPSGMMGRVGGLVRMISHITLSMSTALLGWLTGVIGAKQVFGFAGVLVLLAILLAARGPLASYKKEVTHEQTQTVS